MPNATPSADGTDHWLFIIPHFDPCRNILHLWIGEISKFRLYESNLSSVYIIHVHVGSCPQLSFHNHASLPSSETLAEYKAIAHQQLGMIPHGQSRMIFFPH